MRHIWPVRLFGVALVLLALTSFASAKTELTMWAGANPGRDAIFERLIDEFEAQNPDIVINYTTLPYREMQEKMLVAVSSGTGPDLASIHNTMLGELQRFNLLEPYPVDRFPIEWIDEEFMHMAEYFKWDGRYYAIPLGYMGAIMWYNVPLFKDAGLDGTSMPKTWAELPEMAKKVTKYDQAGNVTQAGLPLTNYAKFLWWDILWQLGGRYFSEDAKEVLWDSPESIEIWEYVRDLRYKHRLDQPGFLEPAEAFGTEKAAMSYVWTWFSSFMQTQYPDVKYGVTTLPTLTGEHPPFSYGRVATEVIITVFKGADSAKKEAAWRFIEWFYKNDDAVIEVAIDGGFVPSRKSLLTRQEVVEDPVISTLAKQLPYMIYMGTLCGATPVMGDLDSSMCRMEDAIMLNQTPIEKATADAVEEARTLLRKSDYIRVGEYYYDAPVGATIPSTSMLFK